MRGKLFHIRMTFLVLAWCLALATPGFTQAAPSDADKLVQEFQAFEAEVMKKAEEELAPRRTKLFADLQALQDALTKAGNLDGALAVRDKTNALKVAYKVKGMAVTPNPGNLSSYKNSKHGDVLYFQVTGKTTGGTVWGVNPYTLDSNLAMAAVHAGVLKDGASGVVKVTIVPGLVKYDGSAKNGVTSNSWGSYSLSYQMEAVNP
jgi:hypothetical protein